MLLFGKSCNESFIHTDFNRKYKITGHVFESRYTACIIEDDRHLLEVSRYIHLNPVKAAMVREPLEYEYSSYKHFVETTGSENVRRSLIWKMIGDKKKRGSHFDLGMIIALLFQTDQISPKNQPWCLVTVKRNKNYMQMRKKHK